MKSELNEFIKETIKILNVLSELRNSSLEMIKNSYKKTHNEMSSNFSEETTSEVKESIDSFIRFLSVDYGDLLFPALNFWTDIQDFLLSRESRVLIDMLKRADYLTSQNFIKIGLRFYGEKPSHSVNNLQILKSIKPEYWKETYSKIQGDNNFIQLCAKVQNFIKTNKKNQLIKEIASAKIKYPDLSDVEINEFERKFYKDKISYDEFRLHRPQKSGVSLAINSKNNFFEKEEKKEPLEEISFDNYDLYFQADSREIERMKRLGKYKIKSKKKTRKNEKL
jgi:hypothetical protein